jgi:hypothetical protein
MRVPRTGSMSLLSSHWAWAEAGYGSIRGEGPNMALEATGHSARFVAGVGRYRVARASACALL